MEAIAILPGRNVRDLIRSELDRDRDQDDDVIASRVLYAVSKEDLRPLVLDAIGVAKREITRAQERRSLGRLIEAVRPLPRYVHKDDLLTAKARQKAILDDLRPDWSKLRKESLDLGDGTSVRWGEATIDQLKQRLTMLRAQVRGITTTIVQMEAVIAAMQEAGVERLDDLI